MLPLPNLDDRSWEDLVHEAVSMIPKYCPQWTNHSTADPGITLIELFAWMMQLTIHRLNQVTDKNYLAFLDLMGIELTPPYPARTELTFSLVPGAKNFQVIPAGTSIATDYKGEELPIIFETVKDLVVLPTSIVKVFSQFHDIYADNTQYIYGRPGQSFEVFMGCNQIERYLYIQDERLGALTSESLITIGVETPETTDSDFPSLCDWEYWNGRRWRTLTVAEQDQPEGYISFEGVEGLESCVINETDGYWIRAKLSNVPRDERMTLVDRIFMRAEVLGEGIFPQNTITLVDGEDYQIVDVSKVFFPFHKEPKPETCFYVSNDDLLTHVGSTIHMDFELSDACQLQGLNPSEDLRVVWEYWNGRQWQGIGTVSPKEVEVRFKDSQFHDTTYCFTRNGTVSFKIPEDIANVLVYDTESYWVRARITQGNYGVQGTYVLNGDRWSWLDERPLRPPQMKGIRLRYEEESTCPGNVLTYNDFRYREITEAMSKQFSLVQVFEPIPEENPTLYIGMNGPFPTETLMLYINVDQKTSMDIVRDNQERLKSYYRRMEELYYGNIRLSWEYWDGKTWLDLAVEDGTHAFTQSGYVEFVGPKEMAPARKFGQNLFWIRVRMEMGGYEQLPRINHMLFNTVSALNRTTYRNELLGSGKGTPNEELYFIHTPVLEGEELWVLEKQSPLDKDMEVLKEHFGNKTILEADRRGNGVWVRWIGVESFYASKPDSRHYVLDRLTGRVLFGDGKHGMVLPALDQNVRVTRYTSGGGVKGNIGVNQATLIRQAIAYIDGVTNHYPATGGSDVESLEELKMRGPHVIKSRYRAVTKEDFEVLSLQSSNSIARAYCLPSIEREGEVTIVVVPKFDEQKNDYGYKPMASTELIRRVKNYLDERKLITVRVSVENPKYVEISIRVEVVKVSTRSNERLKREIEQQLRRFLHPIVGGRDEKGWQFGRSILKVDLYHMIEQVDGVDYVSSIVLYDEDARVNLEQVKLGPKSLPFLVNVEITERARERII